MSKDSTVVEIGALSGNISLYSWKTFGVTDVYAVEALPNNYKVLVKNCQDSPVKTVNVAIGERDGEVSFFEYGLGSSSSLFKIDSSVKYRRDLELKEETRVRAVTLDSFMQEQDIKKIDYLIMNCEGAEAFVFPQIIHNQDILEVVKMISIELHPMILGQRRVLQLIRFMYPYYDCRVITRTIRGPINVIFTKRDEHVNAFPPLYFLQYGYASFMDFIWPGLKFMQKIKRGIMRLNNK